MLNRSQVLTILAQNEPALRQLGVKSLSLFGSFARDEASETSDIDCLVEFDRRVGLFHFIRVQQFLEELFGGRRVDLIKRDAVREELKDVIFEDEVRAAVETDFRNVQCGRP
jgi:predicted nucleotidyltransferase